MSDQIPVYRAASETSVKTDAERAHDYVTRLLFHCCEQNRMAPVEALHAVAGALLPKLKNRIELEKALTAEIASCEAHLEALNARREVVRASLVLDPVAAEKPLD